MFKDLKKICFILFILVGYNNSHALAETGGGWTNQDSEFYCYIGNTGSLEFNFGTIEASALKTHSITRNLVVTCVGGKYTGGESRFWDRVHTDAWCAALGTPVAGLNPAWSGYHTLNLDGEPQSKAENSLPFSIVNNYGVNAGAGFSIGQQTLATKIDHNFPSYPFQSSKTVNYTVPFTVKIWGGGSGYNIVSPGTYSAQYPMKLAFGASLLGSPWYGNEKAPGGELYDNGKCIGGWVFPKPANGNNLKNYSVSVKAEVKSSCNVTADDIDFGRRFDAKSIAPMSGNVTVTCAGVDGQKYEVGISQGNQPSGNQRRMINADNEYIDYNIYQSDITGAMTSTPWMTWDTNPNYVLKGVSNGQAQKYPFWVQIPSQPDSAKGKYHDQLIVVLRLDGSPYYQ